MKEIVTGACLLAISVLMAVLFAAYISEYNKAKGSPIGSVVGLFLFTAAIAFGFSGCGIFIRGVFR